MMITNLLLAYILALFIAGYTVMGLLFSKPSVPMLENVNG